MLNTEQQTERNRAGVREWYRENRDEYNALRRDRYAQSKEARAKARKRAANYRNNFATVENRGLTRELNGKMVPVLSTGEVAVMLGRTPQMIRNWEEEMLIPCSIFPDVHRLYTKKQARMLVTLANTIKRNGGRLNCTAVWKRVGIIREKWYG